MSALVAILACWAGLLCLCGSMRRHQRELLRRRLPDRVASALRATGFALLAFALAVDLFALSVEHGALYWFGQLTVGALATVVVLELRKRTVGARSS